MKRIKSDLQLGNEDSIDSILTRFFRAETPHPWPECEATAPARRTVRSGQFRTVGRLALAASIVLFFLGYFTLAGYFPRSAPSSMDQGSAEFGRNPLKSIKK